MPRRRTFRLIYAGTDITADLTPLTLSLNYVDNLEGEADELSISLINSDRRWLNTWLPGEGDRVNLELGYEDEPFLGPITFEVDEPEWSGVPDTFKLQGLATPITQSLRQRNTRAYENTTLLAIAQQIAETHDLEVIGQVPTIRLKRVTQKEQADLAFLRELAAEYGLLFKVESASRLVFFRETELEAANPVLTLARTDLTNYRLRRQAAGTYKAATVSYQDPESGEFIEATIDLSGAEVEPNDAEEGAISSGDILRIRERCEDRGQADVKAREALKRANSTRLEASLELEGNVLLSAGITIALTGFDRLDGKYLIDQVRHSLDRNRGYRSSLQARKVIT